MPVERPQSPAAFLSSDASNEEIDAFVAILAPATRTGVGTLFSLGYSGLRGADDLRRLLAGTEIDTVVDVRLRPWGRSPFNGPKASRLLVESVGPTYRWDERLGNFAYKHGTIKIADIEAIEDVLDDLRAGHSVALLCACGRPEGCHRQVLADEAMRRLPGLRVVHL